MDLYDVIDNSTDEHRWQAIETLRKKHTLKEIAEKLDNVTYGSLRVWLSNNRDKYELKNAPTPSLSHRNPPTNDDNPSLPIDYSNLTIEQVSEIPYGDLPPTGYVSPLNHTEWGKLYCKFEWDEQYLEDLANEIWDSMKILVKIGRDHGKTWTMIKLWARWGVEVGTKIIAVATQAKFAEIHYAIENIWRSPTFRRDYGDIIDKASLKNGIWFIESLRPRVGPNFIVKGAEGAITGMHFETSEDDDQGGWFHLEDIVLELKVGLAPEKRVRNWFRRTVRYIKGKGNKFTANGTSKDPDDMYEMMENKFHWPVRLMKALEVVEGRLPTVDEVKADHENNMLLDWPDVGTYKTLNCPNWPLEYLLYEFIFHPEDAEPELNNNPLNPAGNYFEGSQWREETMPKNTAHMAHYAVMDPAFGGSATSSKTGILLLAIENKKLYVEQGFIDNASFDEKEDMLYEYYDEYDTLQTYVENNYNQVSRSFNRNTLLQNLPGLSLINSRMGKKERIGALKFAFRKGEIVINKNMKYKNELKQEYLNFSLDDSPTDIRTKYNGLDALSIAYIKLRSYLHNDNGRPGRSKGWRVLG